jgi:uncharacterized membrane protein YhaH (DUF805 family)
MSFSEAVHCALVRYAIFDGRARRSEFWWFWLFCAAAAIAAASVDSVLGAGEGIGVAEVVVTVSLLVPSIAVTVRRLHDSGRSGWWFLILLVPIVGFVMLLVSLTADSDYGENEYGPSSKYDAPAPLWSRA